jgi:hypothetical protein
MPKLSFWAVVVCAVGCSLWSRADVLIVADEFPAMELVARRLKAEDQVTSQLVDQEHLPGSLAPFPAVVVYIHKDLMPSAERTFIDYAEAGGRLVLLHHSISSGKRQNRDWFAFLGVELPETDLEHGGYKWIEGVSVTYFDLAPADPVMSHGVHYSETKPHGATGEQKQLPSFTLRGTEVYLNHVLKEPHTVLMGLQYSDTATGKVWVQDTAGWCRAVKKGWVLYFMPGHTANDFANPVYGRIVLNAITVPFVH